mmetsp:Transcript_33849/g.54490  ORF Transcript_33849/g.54490 Transcript_33849/m.54490 type:complete len:301 (+) Transcript_33849:80-982(+)
MGAVQQPQSASSGFAWQFQQALPAAFNQQQVVHYGDAKLGIRMPDYKTVNDFYTAAENAANAARELMAKTSKGCLADNSLIPWAWHDFCTELQRPVNHGKLWRHIALIAAVDPARMKAQFEGEAKEGALYFKLQREGGGLAAMCVAMLQQLAAAKNSLPAELIAFAQKPIETWTRTDIGIYLFHMGWRCSDDNYWRGKANTLPQQIDGKALLSFSTTVHNASMRVIKIHTPPGGRDNTALRAQMVSVIQGQAASLGFPAELHEQKPRILAQAIVSHSSSTMKYLRTTRDVCIANGVGNMA